MKKLIVGALACATLAVARPAAAHLSIAIGIPGVAVVAGDPPPPVLYRPTYYYYPAYYYPAYYYPAYYAPAPIVFREGRRHGCRHGWHRGWRRSGHWERD